MANEEHLKILKQGVATWNQWREDYPNETLDLHGVDLHGAAIGQTVFGDTGLTDIKGFDSCIHFDSSIIDHDTLTKTFKHNATRGYRL